MYLSILYPGAFMILGLLVMALSSNPTAQKAGWGLFLAGSFALAFHLASTPLRI